MKKINTACVIDDDRIFVYGIKKAMETVDFCNNLLVFCNGKEALEGLSDSISRKETLPDFIFLDLNMPLLDGWQFLDEFIKIPCPKKMTICIASSSVDPEDTMRAKSYEMVSDYIVKPITVKVLKKVLKQYREVAD